MRGVLQDSQKKTETDVVQTIRPFVVLKCSIFYEYFLSLAVTCSIYLAY